MSAGWVKGFVAGHTAIHWWGHDDRPACDPDSVSRNGGERLMIDPPVSQVCQGCYEEARHAARVLGLSFADFVAFAYHARPIRADDPAADRPNPSGSSR